MASVSAIERQETEHRSLACTGQVASGGPARTSCWLGSLARDPDLEGKLSGLSMPVLVLFGTEDQVIPTEMGRIYREKLPNCQLVFVYDAGHALDAERPEAFASVVLDFLDRREGFLVK